MSSPLLVRVSGNSMRPTLEPGDVVLVRSTSTPRVGQVALLKTAGDPVIHRLIDRIQAGPCTWFVHQGDASSTPGLASREEILGVADVARSRRRGFGPARLWGLALRLGILLGWLGILSRRRPAPASR